ncbi:hypothetical protein GIY30_02755 [Gordonia sp. HNM0687]|uniref:GNAT family N-acetyltransferase n=1 Tax=Gordonia mangrovi TaxID=2665643 RepID=A0A6L7GK34_9ACTN|nr:hypothetical protein [Gordonia mangrovi]MXP20279.1 hypothetical protein [Gordonia mangrovi]UVF79118.1 hypothetical protein NWF22_04500 [Gordonia mangrovi]
MTVILDGTEFSESASARTGLLRAPEYTLVTATPRAERRLWERYLRGAAQAYTRHGCAAALDYDLVADGASTARFFAVLGEDRKVVGGLRVQHRFEHAGQSHALEEWSGQRGQVPLVDAIEARLDEGVVEVKTAWVDERSPIARDVAGQLSRLGLPIMELAGVGHMMATAADHVLKRWESGGGRVDGSIPPTPFPDDRYRTQLMWWDRARLTEFTTPETWARMRAEADALWTSDPTQLRSAA